MKTMEQLEKITELRDQWSACNRKLGELIDQHGMENPTEEMQWYVVEMAKFDAQIKVLDDAALA